jgi:uncharacterized protein YndB with AHSA1/START domain
MRIGMFTAAAIALAAGGAARGAVVDASPQGFEVKNEAVIAAPAAKVWAAMLKPGLWWNARHSWSGDARNITIEPRIGGCWCEALPNGGGVEHSRVIFLDPGKTIQFSGADGRLSWALSEKDGKTTVTWTNDMGGYVKGGIEPMAAAVDAVEAEQLARLKAFVETGKPQ